ncbi:hypothetical protein PTTG_30183 [Puccinia triticina 1-1 BBBD Race 1]|uniref:Uncharacterized protein n=1 Tax=Puccinia triticina (isolate 1-1 / race 1 (BBBD)) TaxID=630390 RepID=A0A180FZT7_PUCT1|nr:hypothetical protein PTTG_30183 [Puccinia triticina 1-1 BBBD Race 1]
MTLTPMLRQAALRTRLRSQSSHPWPLPGTTTTPSPPNLNPPPLLEHHVFVVNIATPAERAAKRNRSFKAIASTGAFIHISQRGQT